MFIYGLTLGVLLLSTLLYHAKGFSSYRKAIVTLSGILLLLVAGLRYQVGTDYPHYVRGYYVYLTNSIESLLRQPALTIVAKITDLICEDYSLWFFVMAMIAICPAIVIIKEYSIEPDLSVLLFVLLGCWHFSFNLVKQTAAAGIVFLGYTALKNKSFKKWVVLCLIATTFHFSALLMIPVYFLVIQKPSKKITIIMMIVGVIIYFFYDRFFDLAAFLKSGENLVGLNTGTRNDSVNFIRVLVNIAPILLYRVFKHNIDIQKQNQDDFDILLNMSLLNSVLNLGAMRSIYLYRICVYTNLFNILFIPQVLVSIKLRHKWLIYMAMISLYAIFWWYDLKKGSSTSVFHWVFER